MTKKNPRAAEDTMPSPPSAAPAPAAAEEEPRASWRTIAFARRACTVYLDGGLVKILGGDILDHPPHVAQVRGEPAFELLEMESPEHLEAFRQGWRKRFEEARRELAEAGLVVFRDGEVVPPRKR